MSKVLFITGKVSFISEAIINHLKEEKFEVISVKPDIADISKHLIEKGAGKNKPNVELSGEAPHVKNAPQILILYLQGSGNLMQNVLDYLRSLAEDKGARLFVIGTQDEISAVMSDFPPRAIARTYVRPVDLPDLIANLRKESEVIEKLDEAGTILIVDDDPTALRSIKSLLASKYKIFAANSGMNAITVLARHRVDLILLDFEMPIVNGPKVLEMLRADPGAKDTPVMFLTARSDKESIMEVVHLKPEKYLLKTMSPEQILNSIDEFFAARRLRNPM